MNQRYFEAQKPFMNDDRTMDTPIGSYTFFKEEVLGRKSGFKLSLEDALKNTVRSKYMSYAEMAKINVLEGMKKNKTLWKQFRESMKVKGKYQKFDINNLEFDSETGGYTYKSGRKLKQSEVGIDDPMDELYGVNGDEDVGEVDISLELDYHSSSGITMSTKGVLK